MDGNGWDQHKRDIMHRLDDLERWRDQQVELCRRHQEGSTGRQESMISRMSALESRLSHLEGRLMGFLAAASVLGGLISIGVQVLLKIVGGNNG